MKTIECEILKFVVDRQEEMVNMKDRSGQSIEAKAKRQNWKEVEKFMSVRRSQDCHQIVCLDSDMGYLGSSNSLGHPAIRSSSSSSKYVCMYVVIQCKYHSSKRGSNSYGGPRPFIPDSQIPSLQHIFIRMWSQISPAAVIHTYFAFSQALPARVVDHHTTRNDNSTDSSPWKSSLAAKALILLQGREGVLCNAPLVVRCKCKC